MSPLPIARVADASFRLLTLEEVLATAERVLAAPHTNAVRVSINETVSLAVLARQADAIAADLETTGHLAPEPKDSIHG